jgi:signal transduction histidine kinase
MPRTLIVGGLVLLIGIACISASSGESPSISPDDAFAGLSALVGLLALSLARDEDASTGSYAGVAVWLARPGCPAWAIRLAVVLTAPLAGVGVAAYMLAALAKTLIAPARAQIDAWRTVGTGMLGLAVVLAARAAGLAVGAATVLWAVLLIGSGLSLFWGAADVLPGMGSEHLREHAQGRTALGLLLSLAGAGWVLSRSDLFQQAEGTIAGTSVALAVLALVAGPRWYRTSRLLAALRSAQERAETADYLHDSVLQTLALIQRRAEDPAAVSQLARRQERELRAWLLDDTPTSIAATGLAGSLRAITADLEDTYGARVELVTVGDAPLDERTTALVAAAREALSNAARHAPGAPISVFARVDPGHIMVFVHDRGPGFDPDTIPEERRGIKGSIIARMERYGGHAVVRSTPGDGCEIALHLNT